MSDRDCVVKLVDDHGVEHSVRVRAESVYEAVLKGLNKLARIGWGSAPLNGEVLQLLLNAHAPQIR